MRAVLHLEAANRVRFADEVVGGRVVGGEAVEVDGNPLVLADESHRLLHHVERLERKDVEFDEPRLLQRFLVPLHHDPVLHRRAPQWDEFAEGWAG
ncbi:MAG: hypothetical protein U0841_21875 [Chloroflexia bacterium]